MLGAYSVINDSEVQVCYYVGTAKRVKLFGLYIIIINFLGSVSLKQLPYH